MHFVLPQHSNYERWGCCDFEIQRATIISKENNDYVKSHTQPGQPMSSAFPTTRAPWKSPNFANGYTTEKGPSYDISPPIDLFKPNSHKFGYQYWFRVREHYTPGNTSGPWSGWRSFIVQAPIELSRSLTGIHLQGKTQNSKPSDQQQASQLKHSSTGTLQVSPHQRLRLPTRQ